MQMRSIYQEKQRHWQAFREAENQRRINKANEAEMCRLNGIVAESKARREHAVSQFQHRLMVRSHCQAAVTIQRAYRQMKQLKHAKSKEEQRFEDLRVRRRERAARVIQKAWRGYWQRKMYKTVHFVSIMTGPVLDTGRRLEHIATYNHSYQRGTSITGS